MTGLSETATVCIDSQTEWFAVVDLKLQPPAPWQCTEFYEGWATMWVRVFGPSDDRANDEVLCCFVLLSLFLLLMWDYAGRILI